VVAIISAQVRLDFLHPVIAAVAREDPDLEAIDWTSLRTELVRRNLLPPGTVVGVANWRDTGKIAYALGPDVTVTCLCSDPRELGFAHPASDYIGRNILVLALDHPERVYRELTPLFDAAIPHPALAITLDGRTIQPVTAFTGLHLRGVPSAG